MSSPYFENFAVNRIGTNTIANFAENHPGSSLTGDQRGSRADRMSAVHREAPTGSGLAEERVDHVFSGEVDVVSVAEARDGDDIVA